MRRSGSELSLDRWRSCPGAGTQTENKSCRLGATPRPRKAPPRPVLLAQPIAEFLAADVGRVGRFGARVGVQGARGAPGAGRGESSLAVQSGGSRSGGLAPACVPARPSVLTREVWRRRRGRNSGPATGETCVPARDSGEGDAGSGNVTCRAPGPSSFGLHPEASDPRPAAPHLITPQVRPRPGPRYLPWACTPGSLLSPVVGSAVGWCSSFEYGPRVSNP